MRYGNRNMSKVRPEENVAQFCGLKPIRTLFEMARENHEFAIVKREKCSLKVSVWSLDIEFGP